MSKTYELLEVIQTYAQNGRPIWQAFADDFASEKYLAEVTRHGHPDVADRLRELYIAGDYRAVVKLWDAFFDHEMAKLAAQGNQWAIDYLDVCRDKEALFNLLVKHGKERMRELIELERRTEAVILGWAPLSNAKPD